MKAILVGALLLVGCTNESASSHALRSAGFTEYTFTGYEWFACSEDDTYHTGFRAKNPQGEEVTGVVCCGLMFKACTVRF